MKKFPLIVMSLFLLTTACSADEPTEIKTEREKLNYSVGYQIGTDFRGKDIEIKPEFIVKGLQDAIAGTEAPLTSEERLALLAEMTRQVAAAEREEKAKENLAAGQAFLKENAEKPGVTTLPSGLQYTVIKEGSGPMPKPDDRVTVHYRGFLPDGTELDSSHSRGEPATFTVNKGIGGWREALQLMKTGSTWKLFIPANLAYGSQGFAGVPQNSVLVFELELLSIEPPADDEQAETTTAKP